MTPEQLKASILQRAMEGKLVPQDPNDEPASELLKRIKAEKEKLIKEGKIKRDKNETEIFRGDDGLHYEKFQDGSVKQIDVPYEIPESWAWVKIKSIYWARKQGKPKKDFYYIDTTAIDNVNQSLSENIEKISPDKAPSRARKKIEFGDILFGTVRPYLKNIAIFDKKNDYYVASTAFVVMTPILVKNNFLVYSLLSPKIQTIINQKTTGSNYPAINDTNFQELFIPIPPLQEQVRINNKISELLKRIKQYSYWYSLLDILYQTFPEKLRKSILQYAMQGKLVTQDATDEPVEVLLEKIRAEKQKLFTEGKLKKKDLQESIIYQGDDNSYYENCPNTWVKVSLATISKITSGGTPKTDLKDYYNGEIPWFTPADLSKAQSNYYLDNSLKSITRLGLKNSSAQLIDAYSIVYSSRAPIGYINIVPKQYTTNQGCKSLTPYLVIVKWLYFAMKYATVDIKKNASGTTFLEISASKLGDIYIDLPPISEQERIVDKIEKLWNKIDTLPFTP